MSKRSHHLLISCLQQKKKIQGIKGAALSSSVLERKDVKKTAETYSRVKSFEDIPGPRGIPFFGMLFMYLPGGRFYGKENNEVSAICRKEYGHIYKETLPGGTVVINIFTPEDVEVLFRSDNKFPLREAFFTLSHYNKLYNNNAQGLLTAQRHEWHNIRRNVQHKMLRPKAVSAYLSEHSIVAGELVDRLQEVRNYSGDVIDMGTELDKYAAECIGVVCFNTRLGALRATEKDSETAKFICAVREIMDVTHKEYRQLPWYRLFNTPSFKRFIKSQEIIKELTLKYSQLALEEAQRKVADKCELTGEQGDLVPYLMSKTSLTNEQVYAVISEFIFAGVDTVVLTPNGRFVLKRFFFFRLHPMELGHLQPWRAKTSNHTQFALYLLARNPETQKKLYKEIVRNIPKDAITIDDILKNMEYMKAVTKETHRMLPVTPGNMRKTTKDIVLSGYHVPAGYTVAVHVDITPRELTDFYQPDSFIPERWLRSNENRHTHHPFAFLPFGHGSRSCIGKRFAEQESQLALIKILQKYEVEYIGEELKLEASVTFKPVNKMSFRLRPRQPYQE